MAEIVLWSTTIVTAFVSGMIALFAPCCLTVLLPTYLGSILQSRLKVVAATLVFTLGIATVMLPIGLGMRSIVSYFNLYHVTAYAITGAVMILAGILMFTNFKLPMLAVPALGKRVTFGSLYFLGIASGLASACCAPVLLAAVALTTLSPSFMLALFAALAFVIGMTFPLLLGALFADTRWLMSVKRYLGRRVIGVPLGNLIGAGVMFAYGALIIVFALTGRIAMLQSNRLFGFEINSAGRAVTRFLQENEFVAIAGVIILIIAIVLIGRRLRKELAQGVEPHTH